jgi:hypothetical protein
MDPSLCPMGADDWIRRGVKDCPSRTYASTV